MSIDRIKPKKLYTLDTNVLIFDHQSILNFGEHDVCIPLTVIDELDNLKKSSDVGQEARNALSLIKKYRGESFEKKSLGEEIGNIFIANVTKEWISKQKVFENFDFTRNGSAYNDNMIIATAYHAMQCETSKYDEVILVTLDNGCMIRACSIKLKAEEYRHDSIKVPIDDMYTGRKIIDTVNPDIIDTLFRKTHYDVSQLNGLRKELTNYNQCYILQSSQSGKTKSCLARFKYDPRDSEYREALQLIVKPQWQNYSIRMKNSEQAFGWDILNDKDISLVTITGIAGTGKTLLSLLAGIEQITTYSNILVARPDVALSGKQTAFLPGSERDKMSPLVQPIFDNLDFIIRHTKKQKKKDELKKLEKDKRLKVTSLDYIRGRSIHNTFFIIDEAQNLTPLEIKTIITRAGENTKIVLVGDVKQIDARYLNERSNGLSYTIDRFSSSNEPFYAHISLVKGERSVLSEKAALIM